MSPLQMELHTAHKARVARMGGAAINAAPLIRARLPAPKKPEPPIVLPFKAEAAPVFVPAANSNWFNIIEEVATRVSVKDIQCEVAGHFNVERTDMISERRTRAILRPRQIAMYLSTRLTHRSLVEIGRRFQRDHTTILHARRVIEGILQDNAPLANDVRALEQKLKPRDFAEAA